MTTKVIPFFKSKWYKMKQIRKIKSKSNIINMMIWFYCGIRSTTAFNKNR